MNRLEKDLLFYSNYCLHSNNLINQVSKTDLHPKILYICIDDSKIKVPNFITRVPSLYIVTEKRVLVEDDINDWISSKLRRNTQSNQQQYHQQLQQQQQMQQQPNNRQMPNMNQQQYQQQPPQQQQYQQQPPQQQQYQQQPQQQPPQQQPQQGPDEISAFHSNEMGSHLSNSYSFIEEENNNNMNHNFSFLDGTTATNINDTRINTPKEFNSNNSQQKSQLDTDYDKLMNERNNAAYSKGVQRI